MKLHQKQIQKQKLSPKQILFAKLIQLPSDRLEEAIENELVENPVLEIDNDATKIKLEKERTNNKNDEDADQSFDWEDIYSSEGNNHFKPVSTYDASKKETDIVQEDKKYFIDKLLDQIHKAGLNDDEIQIAEELIGDLDESGYLTNPIENIAYQLNVSIKTIQKVLKIIQKLEPIGIAARDLQECLLLQISEKKEETYVTEILKDHFELFANHNYDKIMKLMGISKSELQHAKDVINKLDPKPGYIDNEFSNHYILPDLIVTKKGGEFLIKHNDSHLPELKLSKNYQKLFSKKNKLDKETAEYLKNKLNSASWFIESILKRRNTMIRVMNAIIEKQKDFFNEETNNLVPMKLNDIAEKVKMDVSTISRVTNGKYVQTPLGLFELKQFFSEGVHDREGNYVSRNKIMDKLKETVANENKSYPLSDEEITQIMGKYGYNIARRTIAKYRKMLNISSAKLRREI
ncbi:MAG: RNA polymerase factor sigma-54 [Candidatus Marinimicrobia bacterium]|nr:RNA polymerase factor sigma-54 [Candidatus Neomarinimicrobiota bacterium]